MCTELTLSLGGGGIKKPIRLKTTQASDSLEKLQTFPLWMADVFVQVFIHAALSARSYTVGSWSVNSQPKTFTTHSHGAWIQSPRPRDSDDQNTYQQRGRARQLERDDVMKEEIGEEI